MKRDIYEKLVAWKKSPARKPLILKGARQVGKTFILNEFGKREFDHVAYFNFEEDPALGEFSRDVFYRKELSRSFRYIRKRRLLRIGP